MTFIQWLASLPVVDYPKRSDIISNANEGNTVVEVYREDGFLFVTINGETRIANAIHVCDNGVVVTLSD